MTTPIPMSMYRSKVEYVFKNGIFQCERFTIATPGSVLHIHMRLLHCDITNGMKGLHSILTYKIIESITSGQGDLIDFLNVCCN